MNKSEVIKLLGDGMTVRILAWQLVDMVDHFWDTGEPDNPCQDFDDLMDEKAAELGPKFIESVRRYGIRDACQVTICSLGYVVLPDVDPDRIEFEDGHHRLALALALDLDVPISTRLNRWGGKDFVWSGD
jgi:hypothetical protein